MAKLYHHDGKPQGLHRNESDETYYPIPDGFSVIEFDIETNAALMAALNTRWNDITISGGRVQLDGKEITVQPDSTTEAERKAIKQGAALLAAYLDLANPTAAQNTAALRAVVRFTLHTIRTMSATRAGSRE